MRFVEIVLPCDLLAWQAFSFTIILSSAFIAGREELRVFFLGSVFYSYYPSTRACTHCAVSIVGIWFWSGDSLSFCYLRYKQYRKRLKSGLFATAFLFFVMHEEWVIEARRDVLHGSSSFFV